MYNNLLLQVNILTLKLAKLYIATNTFCGLITFTTVLVYNIVWIFLGTDVISLYFERQKLIWQNERNFVLDIWSVDRISSEKQYIISDPEHIINGLSYKQNHIFKYPFKLNWDVVLVYLWWRNFDLFSVNLKPCFLIVR